MSTNNASTRQGGLFDNPAVRFILLPLCTAVAFVLLGVIGSCIGGFAVM